MVASEGSPHGYPEHNIYSLDKSSEMRKLYLETGLSPKKYITSDLYGYHEEKKYDFALCTNNSFAEFKDPFFALIQIHSFLKDRGIFFLMMANPDSRTDKKVEWLEKEKVQYRLNSFGKQHPNFFSVRTELEVKSSVKSGKIRKHCVFHRWYSLNKMRDLVKSAQFRVLQSGELNNGPFYFVLAEKKKKTVKKQPSDGIKSIIRTYDNMAKDYDLVARRSKYIVPAWIQKNIEIPSAREAWILDLACGNGHIGRLFRRKIPDCILTGVDVSEKMLHFCKRNGGYNFLLRMDINRKLPMPYAGQYEAILGFGLCDFLPHPEKLLLQIGNLLSNNGRVYLNFEKLTKKSPQYPKRSFFDSALGFTRYRYTLSDIRNLMVSHGLEIVKINILPGYQSPSSGMEIPYVLVIGKKWGTNETA